MESFFIEDGYSLPGYLAGSPGVYPPLRFTYRPCLAEERTAFWDWEERHDRAPKPDADAKAAKKAELIASHVLSWEAHKKDGSRVKVEAAWIRKLHASMHDALLNIVLGVRASDSHPQGETTAPTATQEDADAKN